MSEVNKTNPFHHDKIYDQFKYNKFDTIGSEWSDRISERWGKVCRKYNQNESFVGMILSFSSEDFLHFCSELVRVEPINGARLVKFVNGQSLYNVWRVDYYVSKKPVKGYSDSKWAPNIIRSDNAIDDWDLFEDSLFGRIR